MHSAQTKQQAPPNIIWLVAEDLGPRFDFYGDSLAHTPHLSALAEKSIIFDQAFTVSGVCAPSRSSIITGCYPSSIGTQHMRQKKSVIPMPGFPRYSAVPPPDVKAFPELLRAAGYWTSSYTKLDYQFGEPFTIWDEVSEDPHWRHRKETDQNKPFFLYSTYEITHEINIWPDTTKARFFEEFNLDPAQLARDVQRRPPLDSSHFVDPHRVSVPPYLPDNDITRDHLARLYNNISRMDRQVGKLMADLEADGLLDQTIIFIMSDHGDCLPRAKRWIYDSGIRVPLAIYVPPAYRNRVMTQPGRREDLVSYIDLAPTVLEFAGLNKPHWMHGDAIFSELIEEPRPYVFAARDRMDNRYDTRRAVRSDRFKYIYNYSPKTPYQQQITFLEQMPLMRNILDLHQTGGLNATQAAWLTNSKPQEELYDLKADPHELSNLANNPAYASEMKAMRAALRNWQAQFRDLEDEEETIQAERMWPGREQPTTAQPMVKHDGHLISLSCATQGASLAYREIGTERWEIYTQPFEPCCDIEVMAQRYGYLPSSSVKVTP